MADADGLSAVAPPAMRPLQADATALVADLSAGWMGHCLALAAAYASLTATAATVLGLPMDWLLPYMLSQAWIVLVFSYATLVFAWGVDRVVPGSALCALARRLSSFRLLGELILATIAVHLTLVAFVNLKQWIPVINERLYDSPLWRLDAWLHFGVAPGPVAMRIAAEHGWLSVLDRAYLLFFPAQMIVPLLFLLSQRLRPRRGQFFFAYILLWIVGSAMYLLWPSLGPIYYSPSLYPWIDQATHAHWLQKALIDDYAAFRALPFGHQVKIYYGVAALPSLHVAMFALFAIAARCWRGVAGMLWALTAVTFIGSLALGWHYAVDGYLGLAMAWGCWWIACRAVDAESEPQPEVTASAAVADRAVARQRGEARLGFRVAGAALVAASGIAVFAGTLWHQFAYDDAVHVLGDPRIHRLSNALDFFTLPTWPGNLYRPLPPLTYALTYAVAGDAPWAFHAINVLLHAAVGGLAFLLLLPLVGRSAALLASVLFAVHPVHVEAVANVSGRTEMLAAGFGLAALCAVRRSAAARRAARAGWLAFAAAAFFGALLAKESSVVILLLVPLCLARWRIGDSDPPADGAAPRASASGYAEVARMAAEVARRIAVPLAALGLCLALFLALRWNALGYLAPAHPDPVAMIDNPLVDLPTAERIADAALLLGRYVALLAAPVSLLPDYSFGTPGMPPNLGLVDRLVDAAALVALIAAIALGWWRDRRVTFFGLWFLAAFAVTTNFVGVYGPGFAERLAYLPSLGICGLLALAILTIESRPLRVAIAALAVGVFGLRTVDYAGVWRNNVSLFSYAAAATPANPRALTGLADVLARRGEFDAARQGYDKALWIAPQYTHAEVARAMTELWSGNGAAARDALEEIVARTPDDLPALLLLGRLRLEDGRPDDAGRLFVRVLNIERSNFDARLGIMSACLGRGNLAQAAALRDELMAIDPTNPDLLGVSAKLDERLAAASAGVPAEGGGGLSATR